MSVFHFEFHRVSYGLIQRCFRIGQLWPDEEKEFRHVTLQAKINGKQLKFICLTFLQCRLSNYVPQVTKYLPHISRGVARGGPIQTRLCPSRTPRIQKAIYLLTPTYDQNFVCRHIKQNSYMGGSWLLGTKL